MRLVVLAAFILPPCAAKRCTRLPIVGLCVGKPNCPPATFVRGGLCYGKSGDILRAAPLSGGVPPGGVAKVDGWKLFHEELLHILEDFGCAGLSVC